MALAAGREDKRSRKTPGRSRGARGRREMGTTCARQPAAPRLEAKQDRVRGSKQQRLERVKGGIGQSRVNHRLPE